MTPIYQRDMAVFWSMLDGADYLMQHQIESGLSYGVFDTEYQYKRTESKETAGRVY